MTEVKQKLVVNGPQTVNFVTRGVFSVRLRQQATPVNLPLSAKATAKRAWLNEFAKGEGVKNAA